MIVTLSGVASQPAVVTVEGGAPGVFSVDGTGTGIATILRNGDFTLITSSNPARRGEVLAVYCTGLGAVTGGVTGQLPPAAAATTAIVGVNFASTSGAVTYSGVAVGFAGLNQINVTVPQVSGGTGGAIQLTVRVGPFVSPPLTTYIAGTR